MKITPKSNLDISSNQDGFAAMVIAMVILLVASLISLGFAYQMRQEQQTALGNQLSTQAYYAAESAINDAISFISSNPQYQVSKTDCGDIANTQWSSASTTDFYYEYPEAIKSNISYTCLLVNFDVNHIYVNGVSPGQYVMIPLVSTGNSINSLNISWSNSDGSILAMGNKCSSISQTNFKLPTNSASDPWDCPLSLVEASIVGKGILSTSLSGAADMASSLYLFPATQASPTENVPGPSNGPQIYPALYNSTEGMASISLSLPPNDQGQKVYLKLTPFYGNTSTDFTVTAYDSNNNIVSTNSAQVSIDATGKAAYVLKRLSVRYPTGIIESYNGYAIQSSGPICKQFEIIPTSDGGTGNPSPGTNASTSSNTDCKQYGY